MYVVNSPLENVTTVIPRKFLHSLSTRNFEIIQSNFEIISMMQVEGVYESNISGR